MLDIGSQKNVDPATRVYDPWLPEDPASSI